RRGARRSWRNSDPRRPARRLRHGATRSAAGSPEPRNRHPRAEDPRGGHDRVTGVRDVDDSESPERESTMLRAALTADVAGRPSGHLLAVDEPDAEGPRARVLVADDDPATRELIANTLRASGYEVETSPDGQDAVERVARLSFDVVLLDAVMPRMSG